MQKINIKDVVFNKEEDNDKPIIYVWCGLPWSDQKIHIKQVQDTVSAQCINDIEELFKFKANIFYKPNSRFGGFNTRDERVFTTKYIDKFGMNYRKVCIITVASPSECVYRDFRNSSSSYSSAERIDAIERRFDPPVYDEGWDEIIFLRDDSCKRLSRFYADYDYVHFNQDNPNHFRTLGGHMSACSNYVRYKSAEPDTRLYVAALFHDIGKIKTKTKVDKDGYLLNKSIYYDHHHVGAYEFMCYAMYEPKIYKTFSPMDLCDILNLINDHMVPFMEHWDTDPSAEKKFVKARGQWYADRIKLLHEADIASR